jgi:small subunit ribosomal protein S10e
MLMPKDNRKAIYEYLIEKGVIVAKKDFTCKHPHVKEVPNLHVIKALQSLKSRGFVKEQFAWRHYYWYLTNEGIQHLRDYLHLPSQALPETLRKVDPAKRAAGAGGGRSFGGGEGGERSYGDRQRGDGFGRAPYRSADGGGFPSRGFGHRGGFGRGSYAHA